MEEELNDELEERLYAMLHHVDETQTNINVSDLNDVVKIIENVPQSTVRRYWRTSGDQAPQTPHQKVNQPKETFQTNNKTPNKNTPQTQHQKINQTKENLQNNQKNTNINSSQTQKNNQAKENVQSNNKITIINTSQIQKMSQVKENVQNISSTAIDSNISKPKEEKELSPPRADLSIFQTAPQITMKTVEILDHEICKPVILESSDEDEVIEVELPPKPTITIESSDDDEVCIISKSDSPSKDHVKQPQKPSNDRDSASPVPSVVSSVSDEFIRSDCIALKISSRHPDNPMFDFSLHGPDLLGQTTPSKKKKKKKSKEPATSTPASLSNKSMTNVSDECFATPKSKAKQKKQKSYAVNNKILPSTDVYDSDSSQSMVMIKNKGNSYVVTNRSIPSADVYESDSNQSETIKENIQPENNINKEIDSSDSSISVEEPINILKDNQNNLKRRNSSNVNAMMDNIVDLTENDTITSNENISENIVMGNVSGFQESTDYDDEPQTPLKNPNPLKLGSTKIPPILYDNLDFDNLKGKDKVCKRRRYSLTTLRAEMEKFYNESWGGEEFNHREIQKYMSRDKSLWVIDPKDRMQSLSKKKATCSYCDRPGHRDDMCRMKPPVCYMCGIAGHFEPRCPTKICVNCGSPNHMYTNMCRNCSTWNRIRCAECGQNGHPASHCPDTWRRYHNTIDIDMPLEENRLTKKHYQMYCSGCTRRGHLVHTCRLTIPFSGLPINSPYVAVYRPLHFPSPNYENFENAYNQRYDKYNYRQQQDSTVSSITTAYPNSRTKRQSKSPSAHEIQKEHKKKKNGSISETSETNPNKNTNVKDPEKKINGKETAEDSSKNPGANVEPAPDFISLSSTNRDKKGQIIQDNEVSDTSDVVTMARIYVTEDMINNLKSNEGQAWLEKTMKEHNVTVKYTDLHTFLSIKGKLGDQEAFQAELRDWAASKENTDSKHADNEVDPSTQSDNIALNVIPKDRNFVLKKITNALDSLNEDLGDPNALYKELIYLQNKHRELQQQKVISPKRLSNNTDNIKLMLRKLNMVLLGQAKLADGQQHMNELYSLQQRLTQSRNKKLNRELRKEISEHYQCIFTGIERNDYSELLQKYKTSKKNKSARRKNKKKLKLGTITKGNSSPVKQNIIPTQDTVTDKSNNEITAVVNAEKPGNKDGMVLNAINLSGQSVNIKKLKFYHKRLQKMQLNNTDQKKQRSELIRKLHTHIASIYRKENLNSKTFKKIKKTQAQAHMFLSNV